MSGKPFEAVTSVRFEDGDSNSDTLLGEKKGTTADVEDMRRMGKPQLFRRNFGALTIFSFTTILMSTWETLLGTVAFGLLNGGTAGLIYMYIIVVVFVGFVNVSLAEMASMAPTAGGQYHWVSEFAPRSVQKPISFFIGWLCALGWQAGMVIGCFIGATEIQGLIVLNNDSYVYERWHGTILTIAIILFVALFNTFLAKHLPLVEGLVLCLHIGGFFAILVPLWVLGPRSESHEIWTTFVDGGGWGSVGLSTLIGFVTPATAFLGADSATHMSEELKNASKSLPKAIIWTTIVNGLMGFVMLVTFCYTLGDLEEILATPTGYPFIQVFYNATRSKSAATAMTCIMIVLVIASAMTTMATASRQLFAFARDKGVPGHEWLSHVPQGWDIPLNAIMVTVVFSCLLSLINIGSTVAFNQFVSLVLGALLSSYLISIGCVTLRRLRHQPLLESRFALGKWGLPLNILSLLYLAVAFVMSFFPSVPHPAIVGMNWSSVVYSGVILIAFVHYLLWARHHYVGPVTYVRKSD